jgi:hypothetical protein
MNVTCPECGYVATGVRTLKWGDGDQKIEVAPYLCAGCGAFAVANLVEKTVTFLPQRAVDELADLNPVLHATVTAMQNSIRAKRESQQVN